MTAAAAHEVEALASRPAELVTSRFAVAAPVIARRRMPTSDEFLACIEAVAAQQDRDAFVALFKYFAPRVKGYLIRSGTPAQMAEELAQETMVLLWRRAATFDPKRAALSTWIFTIARNLSIDHHRHATVDAAGCRVDSTVDVWEGPQQADQHAGPDELADAAQRGRRVRRALAELSEEHALVLQLSFFDEQPHAAIARELGIPLGTVKSRIRLAVAQLRRKMEQLKP